MILVGAIIILIMIGFAVTAPLLTKYGYEEINLKYRNKPPTIEHVMGTDSFGRDVWSRCVYGARVSFIVSLNAVAIGIVLGLFLGMICGFFKGRVDFWIGRVMDVVMSFPALLFSLIIGFSLGASIPNMCLSVGIPLTPIFYRMTRGEALRVSERTYVMAAKSIGSGSIRTMFCHVLPNTIPSLLAVLSTCMGAAITAESALGYLGLGIPKPTPSWGSVINEGRQFIFDAPWVTGFGGLMVALTILGFNLIGDGLRDLMDPKLRV
jgi:peptide/nickel transport system permease protein